MHELIRWYICNKHRDTHNEKKRLILPILNLVTRAAAGNKFTGNCVPSHIQALETIDNLPVPIHVVA